MCLDKQHCCGPKNILEQYQKCYKTGIISLVHSSNIITHSQQRRLSLQSQPIPTDKMRFFSEVLPVLSGYLALAAANEVYVTSTVTVKKTVTGTTTVYSTAHATTTSYSTAHATTTVYSTATAKSTATTTSTYTSTVKATVYVTNTATSTVTTTSTTSVSATPTYCSSGYTQTNVAEVINVSHLFHPPLPHHIDLNPSSTTSPPS